MTDEGESECVNWILLTASSVSASNIDWFSVA